MQIMMSLMEKKKRKIISKKMIKKKEIGKEIRRIWT